MRPEGGNPPKPHTDRIEAMAWSTSGVGWKRLGLFARAMRQAPTQAERSLWNRLRGRQLGVRFRRQHAIGQFVVDFYCRERRVVVEVDGKIHMERSARDGDRDMALQSLGLKVLHFTNAEIESSVDEVVARIVAALSRAP
jgi:very-short-patch-repair endonuclease